MIRTRFTGLPVRRQVCSEPSRLPCGGDRIPTNITRILSRCPDFMCTCLYSSFFPTPPVKTASTAATRKTIMGGDNAPPTRQVPDPISLPPGNPDEHPVTGEETDVADDSPVRKVHGAEPQEPRKSVSKRSKRKRGGRRERERERVKAQDSAPLGQEAAASPELGVAGGMGEEKEPGGVVQNGGTRVGSSAQRRRAIAAWREERQRKGEHLERVETAARKAAVLFLSREPSEISLFGY